MLTRLIGERVSKTTVSHLHSTSSPSNHFPDMQALSTAPFMQQVQYGMELSFLLENPESESNVQLKESLKVQLSHSDGIRGFMVAYLSGRGEDVVEGNVDALVAPNTIEIPPVLLEVLHEQLQQKGSAELVSLMCMNVIMPTAMVTMHKDASQSANSARTAQRGLALLQAVQEHNTGIRKNVSAIRQVARRVQKIDQDGHTAETESDDPLIKRWTEFFDKWGYQQQQAADIEKAMDTLLS
ncbi:hypothetical protein IV203_024177 [Nitzschia inconspicua]|uniref:Uncharacterized protein n=1 Tax=Nitzschia inconspicua TaxID=303405 RepID=A0A9K3PD20_9STRA|nr:hypothetical protein IV203_024177 [Nitzschia inconspicua]